MIVWQQVKLLRLVSADGSRVWSPEPSPLSWRSVKLNAILSTGQHAGFYCEKQSEVHSYIMLRLSYMSLDQHVEKPEAIRAAVGLWAQSLVGPQQQCILGNISGEKHAVDIWKKWIGDSRAGESSSERSDPQTLVLQGYRGLKEQHVEMWSKKNNLLTN